MRLFDILLSIFLLALLSPLILFIIFLVKYNLGSPIFFKQSRPGIKGKPFLLYKFRTMKNINNSDGDQLPDDNRLGPFGKFLRSTSVDELPELWNVLKGEMSFVGPRPLLMDYLPLYSARQARRHEVKPGITGWAQINGRNSITWKEKLDMDIWYVNNKSFWLNIKIILITIVKVIKREGISGDGIATMDKFKGN